MFLAPHLSILILWIHVLAACLWIGGQATVAMLIPLLRSQPAVQAAAGRRFQVAAWIAFVLLVLTGLYNIHHTGITPAEMQHDARGRTLLLSLE